MALLETLFMTGAICLIAGGILIIESLLLFWFAPTLSKQQLLMNAISGLGLLSALYFALTAAGVSAIASGLTLGLIGHLGDLYARVAGR